MVAGRPIPAVFLYKEAQGSQFAYNILDGKQRLESLILFIGSDRPDLKVDNVRDYFFEQREKGQAGFEIDRDGQKATFKDLPDEVVREFREYSISTIEIDLDENSTLDEVINLFVDINQLGERVKRFDIVKAIGRENPLLSGVFDLLAVKQKRRKDTVYIKKNNQFTRVLQKLQIVQTASDRNQLVDRMWERLVEIILFFRTKEHRQPGQVLRTFIKYGGGNETQKLTASERGKLGSCFDFLDKCYSETALGSSRLATDLPHFYTMTTALLTSDLLQADGAPPDYPSVRAKLETFARLLSESRHRGVGREVAAAMREYKEASARQTTHPSQRKTREEKFLDIIRAL
jgi:hypothetical protein